jgi:signal transduction histidine kinase
LKPSPLRPWLWPAAIFALSMAAIVAGLWVVDRYGEAAIARQQAANAAAAQAYFVAFAREEGTDALAKAINRHASMPADGFRYALIDAKGRRIAGSDVILSLDTPDSGWRTVIDSDSNPRRKWRVLAGPVGHGLTMIVAEDLSTRDALRRAILQGSALAMLLSALAAAAVGVGLNAALLQRTRTIAQTAERIAGGDLSARVPNGSRGDAFGDLAHALNAMLARIESLMGGMRAVTDSVAHDLRSPLTRLKSALARAANPQLSPDARADAVDQADAEADRALAMLSAMLDIARAESGLSREMMRRIDVGAVAIEMAELFGPAAEDAGQTLQVAAPPTPLIVLAHESLLRQALGNLLHNAVIHAGAGAVIDLTVCEPEPKAVRLTVTDTGRGVPADQLGRVQERFVRLERARTTPGAGLGLALVAACAKLHGGSLELSDNAPGLKAVIDLPALEA